LVGVARLEGQARLDQQAGRAASGVADRGVGRGVDQRGEQVADLLGRIELAGALALPLGELAQQVLVDVRLGVA